MIAGFVLFALAILPATVRQCHGVEAWLLEPSTVALVSGQLRLGIAVVAVGTGPRVKGLLDLGVILLIVIRELFIAFGHLLFLFVLFVLWPSSFLTGVEFVDPSLHASQVEWLAALDAVPDSASLVDWV